MLDLDHLHHFWFDEIKIDDSYFSRKVPQWFFGHDTIFDNECREFTPLLHHALELLEQADRLSTSQYLSLILLLDQIPRNSFRGSSQAYAYDRYAQNLCLMALGTYREHELTLPQKIFLYLPLEHAEDIVLQNLSVVKFSKLHECAPEAIKNWTHLALEKALEHKLMIQQFKCFPLRSRNDI